MTTSPSKPKTLSGGLKLESASSATFQARTKDLSKTFSDQRERFGGLEKNYESFVEDENNVPVDPEIKKVETTVKEELEWYRQFFLDTLSTLISKERTNCEALVDIDILGCKLQRIPVVALIHMEQKLRELKKALLHMPTLDGVKDWEVNDSTRGIFKAKHPVSTNKVLKVQESKVLHPGNEHHPPQAQLVTIDKTVGRYLTSHYSGAVSTSAKSRSLSLVDEAISTVVSAREEANTTALKPSDDCDFADLFAKIMQPVMQSYKDSSSQ